MQDTIGLINTTTQSIDITNPNTPLISREKYAASLIQTHCKHGIYFTSIYRPDWKCAACEELRQGMSNNKEEQPMSNILLEIGLKQRFAKCRLDNYITKLPEQESALALATGYATARPWIPKGFNLTFCGGTGTGKTHLAAGIVKYVASETTFTVKFWRPHDLVDDAFKNHKNYSDYNKGIDLLVLDDLGAIQLRDTQKQIINSILYARWDEKKSTIITTNFSIDELRIYLGERLYSRIIDTPNLIYNFSWDDERNIYDN